MRVSEGWVPKNWCLRTVVLEKTLKCPLDCKKIHPVNPKGNQPWIFIGRIGAEAEAPILWPPDAKSRFIGKDPDVGKDWRQEAKGTTEDEMVGWHHQLSANSGRRWRTGRPGVLHAAHGAAKSWTWLSNRITTTTKVKTKLTSGLCQKNVLRTLAKKRRTGQKEQEKKDQLTISRRIQANLLVMWALNLAVVLSLLPLKWMPLFIYFGGERSCFD